MLAKIRECQPLEGGLLGGHRGKHCVRCVRTIDAVERVTESRDCLDACDRVSRRRDFATHTVLRRMCEVLIHGCARRETRGSSA